MEDSKPSQEEHPSKKKRVQDHDRVHLRDLPAVGSPLSIDGAIQQISLH